MGLRDWLAGPDPQRYDDQRALEEAERTEVFVHDEAALRVPIEPDRDADERELEESVRDARMREREAERLAYEVLNQWPWEGDRREMKPQDRIKFARQARDAFERDAQAGAAVELMNDFVFGRGVPRPRFKNPEAQKVVDEAWDDPDNRLVLTSMEAQYALGVDLYLQCNVFYLVFDDGDDGKVKLALLDHDTCESVVPDDENRLRALWYVTKFWKREWDFERDQWKQRQPEDKPKILYYEHWENVQIAEELGSLDEANRPTEEKLGEGRVYHLRINRGLEQHFGMPSMRRMLRWFSAYNEFMSARVDIAKAAAAFIMKRKIRGGPQTVARLAQQVLNRRSELAATLDEEDPPGGPRPASILNENDSVSHEPFRIDTGSGGAMTDGQMIQGQVSAATHFPRSYYGSDPSSLAGATAVELPVLKAVESRQEVIEGLYRWFTDLVIRRAQETGKLPTPGLQEAEASDFGGDIYGGNGSGDLSYQEDPASVEAPPPEETQEEDYDPYDFSYEFSLPSPQRRMMGELVSSISNIAKVFDPNGTNLELSKTLLTLALGQALEVENPADAVKRIFPPGYKDPVTAAMEQQQQQQAQTIGNAPQGQVQLPTNTGFTGADGNTHSESNPYGAKQKAVTEGRFEDLPEISGVKARKRGRDVEGMFDEEMRRIAFEELAKLEAAPNGSGH